MGKIAIDHQNCNNNEASFFTTAIATGYVTYYLSCICSVMITTTNNNDKLVCEGNESDQQTIHEAQALLPNEPTLSLHFLTNSVFLFLYSPFFAVHC